MDLNGFDYSWARPDPQHMAAAGIKVVARYLYGLGKGITVAERRALHAAGIGVVFNYEADRGNHLKGAAQGKIDGTSARSYAAGLGLPAGTPIYYSCDLEVSPAQMPTVLAYLHAADSTAHPSRAYGQATVCDAFGRPAWQTVAWSYGHVSKNAVMLQYQIDQDFHGSAVDYNTILNIDELGAWWPEGSEHNMPTADEVRTIVRAELRTELEDFGRAVLTGRDSGWFTHDRFPQWIAEPGLRDLATAALSDGDVRTIAAKVAAAVPGATQDTVEAALKSVLTQGVGTA